MSKPDENHPVSLGLPVPVMVAALSLLATSCAGYEGRVHEIRSALLAGNNLRALQQANESLDVDEPDHYPGKMDGENALLVLERGTIKQARNEFDSSSLDFRVADKHLELLDIKNDTMGNIGKWMFSDDATEYRAPPHEKLLLNTLNMLNYLSKGDLESARVEARRLRIMQQYLRDKVSPTEASLGLGSYLAGFTFEASGRPDEALRFYDDALQTGAYPSLAEPIKKLAPCTTYRSKAIEALLPPPEEQAAMTCEIRNQEEGTILAVSGFGLAPYKKAKRLPIGAALVIAGHVTYGPGLGASDSARANELAAKGLLKWVMFPQMTKSKPRFRRASVNVDGKPVSSERGADISKLTIDAWNRVKGTFMAAAITRMITRAVIGEAANQGAKAGGASGGLALLAQIAVEGAMTAADTPDTRSWVTLPSLITLSRTRVSPGNHTVAVNFNGFAGTKKMRKQVVVKPGGVAVVTAFAMR